MTSSAQDLIPPGSTGSTNQPSLILQPFATNPPPAAPVVPPPVTPAPIVPESAIVTSPSPIPAAVAPSQQPFRWGPVTFRPHVSYRFTYGNGLSSSPGNRHNSIIQAVAPGIGIDIGSVWRLDYTPFLTFYSDPHFKNTVNHAASLTGGTVYKDWTLGLAQSCRLSSSPRVETGQQTDRESYVTSLNATYQINASMTMDLGLKQDLNYVDSAFTNSVGSTKEWSTMDWLDYHWGPNIGTGIGIGGGYNAVERGSDTTYQMYQGRVTWHLLQSLSVIGSGGAQVRQFLDSGQPDLVNPIFSFTLVYQPLEATTLSLSANRKVNQSYYYADQVTESVGFNAALSQRLLGKLYLGLSGGYANSSYKSSVPGYSAFTVSRNDDYTFFSANLSTPFLQRGSASIFYSWSSNTSNTGGYGYDSNQVGFQLAYGY